VQLRRALLLFAIVLGLGALAAQVAPSPKEATKSEPPAQGRDGTVPRLSDRTRLGRTFRLRFEAGGKPRVETVTAGAHVIVSVAVPEPGQVELEGFGLVASAEPATPAVFDVVPDDPGRFDALFRPIDGARERAGTLVVRD
jgi:hypothetical protein